MANESPFHEPGQLAALLDRWQTSLDLHARYAALDDERYWQVQPWPRHERPQRWIIQLARKRILALKRIVAQRQSEGDRAFIESIEIMGFLATLHGPTSIERHIPLATPETERHENPQPAAKEALTRTAANRKVVESMPRPVEQRRTAETTRQMPALTPARPPAMPRASAPQARPSAPAAAPRKREPSRPATIKPKKLPATISQMEHVVIADAVRLLGWGRQWHELAEMIARLSERPAPSEIRRILRTYRDQIDAVAEKRRE